VNNVGRSHDIAVYFDEAAESEINDILEVNIHATVKMTRMVLPTLLRRYVNRLNNV
jgi:17beta-estradiol 17-dehydrogenase / very-long-chain 3-oxoacyl-CoA reductase